MSLLNAVKEAEFVPIFGGERLRPHEVKTWGGEFGSVLRPDAPELERYKLVHTSVIGCHSILRRLNAVQFTASELFDALQHCKNETTHECKMVVRVLVRQGLPAPRVR